MRFLSALHVAQLELEHAGNLEQQVPLNLRVALGLLVLQRIAVDADQLFPRANHLRQALDFFTGQLRRWCFANCAAPPLERRDLIDQLVLADLGDALNQRLTLCSVGQLLQLHFVDLDQLLPLLGHPIQRL